MNPEDTVTVPAVTPAVKKVQFSAGSKRTPVILAGTFNPQPDMVTVETVDKRTEDGEKESPPAG